MDATDRTVVVAMSGGVDSSVAALLLQRAGYRVIGVTMQIWPREQGPGFGQTCCGLDAIEDARKVAYKLGIPHYTMDFRDAFERDVIAYFCREYAAGRTPNPCIKCNERIKFGALLERARQLDADFLATGHYARVQPNGTNGAFRLLKGVDPGKDQSYFLYCLRQEQLKHTGFPVGNLTKAQVRRIAAEAGLAVAEKHESQEICFIPDNDYGRFVPQFTGIPPEPGPIVDISGRVLGQHRGIVFYTVGQRHGLGLGGGDKRYVIRIEPGRNAIVVGTREEVFSSELVACGLNWIGMESPAQAFTAGARIRHRHEIAAALISPETADRVRVRFETPQMAITPGQAVVFYDGDFVLGGGTIQGIPVAGGS